MQRRELSRVAAAVSALGILPLAVRGSLASSNAALVPVATGAKGGAAMGTNLSGMEWARPGLRYGMSTAPNLNFTVPRAADVAYLAACGYAKNRLPVQWELLQPMLHDTVANGASIAAIGQPGAFHAGYEACITGVLDAHAAVGSKCIIDNHNYCRYQDFRFQADGSVPGLTRPQNPLLRAYTTDRNQVQTRIFSLAEGATLRPSHFVDFWTRAAKKWKDHPGFGGYGLMNEPHDMPKAGGVLASNEDGSGSKEDLTIWPAFARAAIDAIRAIDPVNPIYVAGNQYSSAMAIGSHNPGFPLKGDKLIYEVHMYLDAANTGAAFDYDLETAKGFSAGFGRNAIHPWTGRDRIKIATDWAAAHGVKLALTEIGMPIDDPRWAVMFGRAISHARNADCEIYTWMGGSHWPVRNYALNHVPGWHQNRTLEPLVSGQLKAVAGTAQAAIFDDGPGYAPDGEPIQITVYARGNLARPVTLKIKSNSGGAFSKTTVVIPAGPNGEDSFSFTPVPDGVATLSYLSDGQVAGQAPPSRKVFSIADPVAHARVNLQDAAMAIIAKYGACKWAMSDGYTDYLRGAPAAAGQTIRAVADSGYGSSPGNAMEMLNWVNKDPAAMGEIALPVMRVTNGKKHSDHSAANTWGFWCKKSIAMPRVQPRPKNRIPYNVEDAHFAIVAMSIRGGQSSNGVVFQASQTEKSHACELNLNKGVPGARWVDSAGQAVQLAAEDKLPANRPSVLALTSTSGLQQLRVNSSLVGKASAAFAPSPFNQMLIGWGYLDYYPRDGFGGNIYAVITGKGVPTDAELLVLESYLGTTAGLAPIKV